MSAYTDDLRALSRYEKVRLGALAFALGASVLSAVLDVPWLAWPRAMAWVVATAAAFLEARLVRRLGRDADAAFLRAAVFALGTAYVVWLASKG